MKRQGFTLIELMIVVLVIGILAAVGIPKYQSFVTESRQRACASQLKSVDQAIAVWETQNTAFPINDFVMFPFYPRRGLVRTTWNTVPQLCSILSSRTGAWTVMNYMDGGITGLIPTGDAVGNLAKDHKMFVCPEILNYYPRVDYIPDNWQMSYIFCKVSLSNPGAALTQFYYDWVPNSIGRAVCCSAFGYNANQGLLRRDQQATSNPPRNPYSYGGRTFYPGCGGPDGTRATLHLMWGK